MEIIISKSEKNTKKIGKKIAKNLKNGDIVLLYGDLGAGKTVFVLMFTKYLDCFVPRSNAKRVNYQLTTE